MHTYTNLYLAHPLETWTPFDIVVNSVYALLTMSVTYKPTNVVISPFIRYSGTSAYTINVVHSIVAYLSCNAMQANVFGQYKQCNYQKILINILNVLILNYIIVIYINLFQIRYHIHVFLPSWIFHYVKKPTKSSRDTTRFHEFNFMHLCIFFQIIFYFVFCPQYRFYLFLLCSLLS